MAKQTPDNPIDRGLVTDRKTGPTTPVQRTNHLLVIGINAYQDATIPNLNNARKDAEDVEKTLLEYYEFGEENVHRLYDEQATRKNINLKLHELQKAFQKEDPKNSTQNLVIYIAGHGHFDRDSRLGYFIPHDGIHEEYFDSYLQHGDFKDRVNAIKAHHIVLLLDSCFSGSLCLPSRAKPGEVEETRRSRKVLTSGSIELVSDGFYNDNSPFAKYLLEFLQQPGKDRFSFDELATTVKNNVSANSDQQPYAGILAKTDDLGGDFFFQRRQEGASNPIPQKQEDTDPVNQALGMVFVEGGKFTMGNDEEEEDSIPEHEVELRSFFMAQYPTTFEQFDEFCSAAMREIPQDEDWGRGRRPVIFVNWYDALDYCNWLSQKYGLEPAYAINDKEVSCDWQANGFRLPSEAEWEYAARGGQNSLGYLCAGSNKIAEVGWFSGNSGYQIQIVGQKKPNELDLFDMNGNTWEWCWDAFSDDYYEKSPFKDPKGPENGMSSVVRGGSWGTLPNGCRVYARSESDLLVRMDDIGFRVVRSVEGDTQVKSRRVVANPLLLSKPTPKPASKLEQALKAAGMVFIPGGKFKIGEDHEIELSDFYLGKYTVTFAEYDRFCEASKREKPEDQSWGRGKRPVINVTWYDAVAYCNWLSEQYHLDKAYQTKGEKVACNWQANGFRLPTQSEWGYAARGGQKSQNYGYAGSNDPNQVGWYDQNSGGKTQEVGQKKANELGLYDMSGNVWDWCWDWYGNYDHKSQKNPIGPENGDTRVVRGGSWHDNPNLCRVSVRGRFYPYVRNYDVGFRVARR
jgi:formylglycine-generating enzyme required for sulfatase activity